MDAARFEQHFSWVKGQLREAAETLEEEGDLFKARAARTLKEKGPREALPVLQAVGRTIEGITGKAHELDDSFRAIVHELGR